MQRLTNWFEDHLPLRRRSISRRANSCTKFNNFQAYYWLNSKSSSETSNTKSTLTNSQHNVNILDQNFDKNLQLWQSVPTASRLKRNSFFPKTSPSVVSTLKRNNDLNNKDEKKFIYNTINKNQNFNNNQKNEVDSISSKILKNTELDYCHSNYSYKTICNSADKNFAKNYQNSQYLQRPCALFSNNSTAKNCNCLSNSIINDQESNSLNFVSNKLFKKTIEPIPTNSLHNTIRTKIRTNPWISENFYTKFCCEPSCASAKKSFTISNYISLEQSIFKKNTHSCSATGSGDSICTTLQSVSDSTSSKDLQKKCLLTSSTCSSGYGSHDSSPECSVHLTDWSNNNNQENAKNSNTYCNKIDVEQQYLLNKKNLIDDSSNINKNNLDNINSKCLFPNKNITTSLNENNNLLIDNTETNSYGSSEENKEHMYYELERLNRFSTLFNQKENILYKYCNCKNFVNKQYSENSTLKKEQDSSSIYAVPHQHYDFKKYDNFYENNNIYFKSKYYTQSDSNTKNTINKNIDKSTILTNLFHNSPKMRQPRKKNARIRPKKYIELSSSFDYDSTSSEDDDHFLQFDNRDNLSNFVNKNEEDNDSTSTTTSCSSWTPVRLSAIECAQKFVKFNNNYVHNNTYCVSNNLNTKKNYQKNSIENKNFKKNLKEMYLLAKLDEQIAELQLQSDTVKHLVEQAKQRHEMRAQTRQLCMQHLRELRKIRWIMNRNFELCL